MTQLSWTIGAARITRILEREARLPLQQFIPAATAQALAPHRAALAPHFLDADNCCTLAIQTLVIESGGKRIVVDTCLGEHRTPFDAAFVPPTENFLDKLSAAGFARETIDVVLCTHLHFDHVGWNTMRVAGHWVPTFPNARYLFARTEWEHWSAQAAGGSQFVELHDTVQPIVAAGLVDWVASDHRVTDDVQLLPTPGHTPGHVSVLIQSQGAAALITGDISHHPVQWAEPEWGNVADSDSARAAQTRRQILAQYCNTAVLVIGTHYPAPCAGHLVGDQTSTRFQA